MTWPVEPGRARPGRERGYTLLEMIIVLAVLGLVVGLVAARGPQRSHGLDVRGAVASVVRTLRQARGQAVAANRTVTVAVNGARRTIGVDGAPAIALAPELGLTAAAGLEATPGPKLTGIRFAPDGSSTGGRIVLADGRRRIVVGVDWLTGRVSVADAP